MRRLLISFIVLVVAFELVPMRASATADPPSEPSAVVPLAPKRVLETRSGEFNRTYDRESEAIGRLSADSVTRLKVRNRVGVAFDAVAVLLNVTAIAPGDRGYVTVYPCDAPRPVASHLNYEPGTTVPNAVLTKVGAGGLVCIYTRAEIDMVVDVNGYVPYGGAVEPLVPARILETRPGLPTVDSRDAGIGRRPADQVTELVVRGRAGVADDATAVFLNVTAVNAETTGYLTVYPCGEARPLASNVNFVAGQTVPNAVATKIGTDGKVCIYSIVATDVLVDVNGYVPAGSAIDTLTPARLLETRTGAGQATIDGQFQGTGAASWGSTVVVDVAGRGGVPADAEFALLNVTAIRPEAAGYLTVFPCDENRPLASNVNYAGGDVRPNFVLAKLAADGTVCVFTYAQSHLVVDVAGLGSYTPSAIEQLRRALTDGNQTVFGSPRLGVFACLVPAGSTGYQSTERIELDVEAIVADANRIVAPYFDVLSGGTFVPEFVAMTSLNLDLDDTNYDCLQRAADADLVVDLAIGVDDVPSPDGAGAIGLTSIRTQAGFRWAHGMWISGVNVVDRTWKTWTHELGHAVFWKHGASHDGFPYGDHWDVMGWSRGCRIAGDPFGDVCAAGQQTQAMNRFASGWIAEDLVEVHEAGSHRFEIGPLGSGSTELVVAPAAATTQALTIEARVQAGYDEVIDAEGVLVRFSDGMNRRAAVGAVPQNSCNSYPPTCDRALQVGDSVTVAGVIVTVVARTGDVFTVDVSGTYGGRVL